MDRLPDTAGDEAGEQGDVVIGDVMIRDATIAAVTNVAGAHQVIFAELTMRTVGEGSLTTTPMARKREPDILVDHINHRRLQLVGVYVLRVRSTQCLRRCDFWGVAGGLVRAEIAAITKHRENVTLDSLRDFRIG